MIIIKNRITIIIIIIIIKKVIIMTVVIIINFTLCHLKMKVIFLNHRNLN